MESPFHYVVIRTFCYATEDSQKVEKALSFVANCKEKGKIKREKIGGYFGDMIEVLELLIKNASSIKALCAHIFTAVSEEEIKKHVDEDCFLILRLSKQDAFEEHMVLAHGNDVIFLKGKIRAYPSNRENALQKIFMARRDVLAHTRK